MKIKLGTCYKAVNISERYTQKCEIIGSCPVIYLLELNSKSYSFYMVRRLYIYNNHISILYVNKTYVSYVYRNLYVCMYVWRVN